MPGNMKASIYSLSLEVKVNCISETNERESTRHETSAEIKKKWSSTIKFSNVLSCKAGVLGHLYVPLFRRPLGQALSKLTFVPLSCHELLGLKEGARLGVGRSYLVSTHYEQRSKKPGLHCDICAFDEVAPDLQLSCQYLLVDTSNSKALIQGTVTFTAART
eukprot:3561021-Amphidinium_carterae.1